MTNTEWVEQVTWTPLEPKAQQPFKLSPIERYGHAADFSKVCSLGYTIEEGVLAGRIVLETLLVRRAHTSFFFKSPRPLLPLASRSAIPCARCVAGLRVVPRSSNRPAGRVTL